MKNAETYDVQITLDVVNGPWVIYRNFSNSRKMPIDGLTKFKTYWIQIRTNGRKGTSDWSRAFSIDVL